MTRSHRASARIQTATLVFLVAAACRGSVPEGTASGVRVDVSPRNAEVVTRGTVGYAAKVVGSSVTQVSWTVQEAGGGSIDPTGLYSAPGTTGVFHVVATSVADPSKSGAGTVNVVAPPALSVAPNPASVAVGGTQQFTVTPGVPVTWSVVQTPSPAKPPPIAFPLRVAPTGRYLVDQNDQPTRIQADAGWLLASAATPAMVDQYLADRAARGFNAFYLMAMVHQDGYASYGAPNAPDNYNGDPPFATPGVFSTAEGNAASVRYWANVESVIDKAAARGMAVMLFFTYLGYSGGNQGWWAEVLAQPSRQALFDWGAWLGSRFRDKTNIIWGTCGDYTPPPGSEGEARVIQMMEGIRSATPASTLFMTEMNSPNTVPTIDAPTIGNLLDMNSYYGYGATGRYTVYEDADRAYRASAKPAWVQEGGYEYENNTGQAPSNSQWLCRRTRLWSSLAGGTAGDGFGSRDVWSLRNWPGSLASPGSRQSTYAFDLFASLPWWALRPSGTGAGYAGKTLVTSGGGSWTPGTIQGLTDTVTSAVTSDGTWLLAYVPGTNNGSAPSTLTIDMTAMSRPARARWWNPATGVFTSIGTALPNTGTRSFTTPASNGDGNDWLLVLDVSPGEACGTITATGLYSAPAAVPAGMTCKVKATLQSSPTVEAFSTVQLR
jgi:hypothetical protein